MVDKNELRIILQLNDKIRYNNPKDVQTAYNWAIKEQRLKKALGQRYIKRLKQIMDGTDLFAGCLICEKDLDNDSVICTSCLNKSRKLLQAGQEAPSTPAAQGEMAVDFNDIAQKVRKTTETVAKGTGKAAKEVKNKLAEQMESENVKKAVDKSKKASRSVVSFWKSLPRKARLIVTAVLVIVVAFAFLKGGGGSVSSPEEALALVEEMYPSEAGYSISYGRKMTMSKAYFEGEVGEMIPNVSEKTSIIEAYDFDIENPASGVSGYIYVSANGRMIAEDVERKGMYRIR